MDGLTDCEQQILQCLRHGRLGSGASSDELARALPGCGNEPDLYAPIERLREHGLVITHLNTSTTYPRYDLVLITDRGTRPEALR